MLGWGRNKIKYTMIKRRNVLEPAKVKKIKNRELSYLRYYNKKKSLIS